jgi:hypothetical protein
MDDDTKYVSRKMDDDIKYVSRKIDDDTFLNHPKLYQEKCRDPNFMTHL